MKQMRRPDLEKLAREWCLVPEDYADDEVLAENLAEEISRCRAHRLNRRRPPELNERD